MSDGAGREVGRNGRGETVVPGILWSVILLAAPFLSMGPAGAVPWGVSAALLLGVFPPVLVSFLQRRNDLRRFPPSSLPSVVLGAAALAGMMQWAILWLQGPRALSAAAFGLLASALVLMVANAFTSWSWLDLTLGAGTVMLASTAYLLLPGVWGLVAAAVLVAGQAPLAVLRIRGAAGPRPGLPRLNRLAAMATGAAAGGGVFLWLLSISG